jgi:PAS domain S-box-containing protein
MRENIKNLESRLKLNKKSISITISLLSLFLIANGFLYYNYEKNSIRISKHEEIAGIAQLKTNQILNWIKERNSDAVVVTNSPFFSEGIKEYLANERNLDLKKKILNKLNLVNKGYNFKEICLFSNECKLILSTDNENSKFDSQLIGIISKSVQSKKIIFSDLYNCDIHQKIHYDIISPISDENFKIIAVLVFRIDPYEFLYPLIQSWPTPSKSSETLLLRRDKDSVVILNELRHKKNKPLSSKIPITSVNFPAVMAALGYTGIFEGQDYREVSVLSDTRHVPGTNWFMVAKVDQDEIYSELRFRAIIIGFTIIILIFILSLTLYLFYVHRQRRLFEELYVNEKKLLDAHLEFKTTLYSIGDAVISTDIEGKIVNMNPVAEIMCGITEQDAKGLELVDIFNIVNAETRERVVDPVKKVLEFGKVVGLANHTVLISKDGKEYQIADSAAPIKNNNGDITGVVLVFSDVTEKYATQISLEKSEMKFRSTVESSPYGMIFYHLVDNDKLIITGANPAADKLLNLNHSLYLGKDVEEAFPSMVGTEIPEKFKLAAKSGEFWKTERLIYENENLKSAFEITVFQIDKNKIVAMFNDITQRKSALDKLNENEYWLSESQRIGKIGTYYFDIAINQWKSSKVLDDIFGIEENVIKTLESWNNLIHPDDQDYMLKYFINEVIGKKKTFDQEYRIVRANTKEIKWVLGRGELKFDENGNPIKMLGTIQDITERKLSDISLLEKESQFRTLFTNAADPIFIADIENSTIIDVNNAACELVMKPYEEIIGVHQASLHPKENENFSKEVFKSRIVSSENNYYIPAEHQVLRADGTQISVEILASKVIYKGRNCLMGIFRDISERKKFESELIKAKEQAEESENLKTAFLQNMSHEIRTPLNGILGFANLLKDDDITSDEIDEYTGIIKQSGNRLLEIVNNILDISKIETGQLVIYKKDFYINTLIMELNNFFLQSIKNKDIILNYVIDNNLDEIQFYSDEIKINQIMTNLINNAIKFTNKGQIDFGYKQYDDKICFFVKDTGEGINKEFQAKLFERFTQGDVSLSRGYEGAGLGLAITKGLVELLDGRIWFESEVSQGSSFYCEFPFISSNISIDKIVNRNSNKKINAKILIAEDDYVSYQYLTKSFKEEGIKILRAENGIQAVEMVKEIDDIDLILMDIKMPFMDGIEATIQIKELKPNIPIIAQTAFAFYEEKEQILLAGCDEYLSKPINIEKLRLLISKYVDN